MMRDRTPSNDLKFDYASDFLKEVNLLNKFNTVISESNYELSVLAPYLTSHKLQLIPHLVDNLRYDSKQVAYQDRDFKYDLLFVGHLNPPNEDGIKFFLDFVFGRILEARPTTQLAIVGKVCDAIQIDSHFNQNVKLLGYVPDISEVYLQSKVVTSPVLTGAGASVKLIEAMSYALPIVITKHSASALLLQDGVNTLIADDPVQFADYCLSLLTDPQFAEKLSQQVKIIFEQQYSMLAIYSKLDAMFDLKRSLN